MYRKAPPVVSPANEKELCKLRLTRPLRTRIEPRGEREHRPGEPMIHNASRTSYGRLRSMVPSCMNR